jgi:hypothetical protein
MIATPSRGIRATDWPTNRVLTLARYAAEPNGPDSRGERVQSAGVFVGCRGRVVSSLLFVTFARARLLNVRFCVTFPAHVYETSSTVSLFRCHQVDLKWHRDSRYWPSFAIGANWPGLIGILRVQSCHFFSRRMAAWFSSELIPLCRPLLKTARGMP